jgi:hypothetical protein
LDKEVQVKTEGVFDTKMFIQSVTKLDPLVQMSFCRVELEEDIRLLLSPAETKYPGRINLILFVAREGKGRRFVL